MRTSADIWQMACIDLSETVANVNNRQSFRWDTAAMVAWFLARPGRFRVLGLKCTHGDVQLPPLVTGVLLSTQATSLHTLWIDPPAYGLRAGELAALQGLKGLQELLVHVAGEGLADRGTALLWAASRMPVLHQLAVSFMPEHGGLTRGEHRGLPRCQKINKLRSDSLKQLTVFMGAGTGEVLRLSGNPNLTRCRLCAAIPSRSSCGIEASSFEGCTRMKELTLQYQRSLSLPPGCFDALSALTSLKLPGCDLSAVPPAIASLTSLHSLDLSQNEHLQIDDLAASMLRSLKGLRKLDVAKHEPAMLSATSVQALVDVMGAFRDEGLSLHVNFDIRNSTCLSGGSSWGFIAG